MLKFWLTPFHKTVNLDPIPMLVDIGKQGWVWICKKPKAAEYDPLVLPGVCFDQHTTEAQGEDIDLKITRYAEAVEICKHQAGTGELNELLLGLHFKCNHKGAFEGGTILPNSITLSILGLSYI